jgi:O-antigen/teichoic acid export membrane protein
MAGAVISAISYPVYLHFLGYEQYGLWLAVSVVLSFAAFGQLGLAPAVATAVAEEYAKGDLRGVRNTVSTALIALSVIGVIAVGVVMLCGAWIISAMHLPPQLSAQARTLLPLVALLSLYVVQIDTINAVVIGLGRLDIAVGTQQAGRVLSLVLAAALLNAGAGVASLPFANLAGYLFVHIASLFVARTITRESCFSLSAFSLVRLRSLVTFGSGVLASSLINFLVGPLNKFALARYVGTASIPIYDMAFTITMQIRGVLDSGFRSVMPEVSRLRTLGSAEARLRIQALYRRAMKIILGAGLPLFGCAIAGAHIALHLWLGTRFRADLVPALRILLLGGFGSLIGVPSYHMLLGLREVKHVVAANVLQGGLNAAILASLIYAGLLSAASAAGAASVGVAVGGFYLFFVSRVALKRAPDPLLVAENAHY